MTLTRRALLNAGAVAAAAAAIPAAQAARAGGKFDEVWDVVVVGSGFAGLAAASAAREAGAKVLVIEKMAFPGGNSAISGGMIAVPGSSVQKEAGIADSPAALYSDMMRVGQGMADPAHVKLLCEEAAATFEWSKKALGVHWRPELTGKGGHSAKRCLVTEEGSGQGIIGPALTLLKANKVPVRTKCYLAKILREDRGPVTGIVVREGWEFGKPKSGKVKRIGVRKGLVLATGGFCADVTYRTALDARLGPAFQTTNQPGATAEVWREASSIGARIIRADRIQCLPGCSPSETGMGIATHFASIAGALYGLYVSSLTGERFANEFGDRGVLTAGILNVVNAGGKALSIADETGVKHLEAVRPGLLAKMIEAGSVKRFESWKELAGAYDIPEGKLEATMLRFNGFVKAKKDADFGRPFGDDNLPIKTGPVYVSEMSPKVHHAMGGLMTTLNCEVTDVKDDKAIPGLFAAGEVTGSIHGAERMGACSVLDCLVNGRRAGLAAAGKLAKKSA